MNNHRKIIAIQALFLVVVFIALYLLYPKADITLSGNVVSFDSTNAETIIISENPDFSNPRYIDVKEKGNFSFNLPPGTYYWKTTNGLIQGVEHELTIKSEVGMKIAREKGNESKLVNIGNVKINVTKNKKGVMVGHIVLEPNQSQEIQDEKDEKYTGRQI
jgi:hypothetical protein